MGLLLALLGGCVGYVLTDRAFKMNGYAAYTWVTMYFLIISVEMAYGKHIVGPHLNFASMSTSFLRPCRPQLSPVSTSFLSPCKTTESDQEDEILDNV